MLYFTTGNYVDLGLVEEPKQVKKINKFEQ